MAIKKIIMIDQAHNKWSKNNDFAPLMIIALMMAIGVIAMLSQAAKAESSPKQTPQKQATSQPACSVTGAVTDVLMSDEMALYLSTDGAGQQVDEGDME